MNVFGVGPTEIFVILIVILVLFGPDKLPELAKKIGGASREMRENLNALNTQMNSALETSMELDKSKMIPPAEPAPPKNPDENQILPTTAGAPILPSTAAAETSDADPPPPAPQP